MIEALLSDSRSTRRRRYTGDLERLDVSEANLRFVGNAKVWRGNFMLD